MVDRQLITRSQLCIYVMQYINQVIDLSSVRLWYQLIYTLQQVACVFSVHVHYK